MVNILVSRKRGGHKFCSRDNLLRVYFRNNPVYGITPQESLAGTDQESEKRDSPFLDQTVLRVGDKQNQFSIQTGEVTTPLTQFTQNIMGTSVITVTPKSKDHADQNVYATNAHSARFLST